MRRDIVVIGGSAGALRALREVIAHVPAEPDAALLVATHIAPAAPARLADVLNRVGAVRAVSAFDGMPITPGRICTAVPDRHLLVGAGDVVRLSRGPRENLVRPAIDALFRSAARWYGPRVIGVVLSGTLDDAAAGLAAVAERGGVPLVLRPQDALFDGMPRAAITAVPDATVLSAAGLGDMITQLAGQPVPPATGPEDPTLTWETDMALNGHSATGRPGEPAMLGCPECGGGMNAVRTGNAVHYLCHAGHSFSPQTFLNASDEGIETALWTALSAMQEKAMVLEDLAAQARAAGDEEGHRQHHVAAGEVRRAAEQFRAHVLGDREPHSAPGAA